MAKKTNGAPDGKNKGKGMNPIMRNVVKSFIPMISQNLGAVNDYLVNYLAGVELQQGEARASIVCSTATDGQVYIIVCTFDENDKVIRLVSKSTVTEFIQLIIKNI